MMLRKLSGILLLFACASFGHAATVTTSTLNQLGNLVGGADPFFWANTSIAALATADTSAAAVSCGANCSLYSLNSLNFLIASSQLYAVSNPYLEIIVPAAGSSIYQVGGNITVGGYDVVAALSLALPEGTLTSAALTAPPAFPLTVVDAANTFDFYTVTSVTPTISAQLSVLRGTAVSIPDAVRAPEPASFLLGIPLAGLFLRERKGRSV